jgi:hypothetical protein
MRGQADRIVSLMGETIKIGIIPLDADTSVIPWVGFNLYDDLPEGQTAFVTVELPHAYLTASEPGDVEIYQQHKQWKRGRKPAPGYAEQCRQLTEA